MYMGNNTNGDRIEVFLDLIISLVAFSAAAYAAIATKSYYVLICAMVVAALVIASKNHNLSSNIGANLENAHYLIIPVVIVGVIWIGALNVVSSQPQWPIISGMLVSAVYLKDAIQIFKTKIPYK